MDATSPAPSVDSPDVAQRQVALGAARRIVQNALADAIALRGRVMMLADATDWRSRGAEGYRAGMTDFRAELDRLVQGIATFDDDLAVAAARGAGMPGRYGPFASMGW